MANDWFETVAEAQRRAKARLPKSVYGALIAGSEKGLSTNDNLTSFDQLGFAPHVAGNSNTREMSTTIMGQSLSMPVIISPTGVQAVHPQGEVAIARAAANRGIPMGLSSFASKSVEDVAAVNDSTLFQMYWCGDRATLEQRMERARAAGAKGLIVTLDWSFSNGRDWGSPWIPEKIDLKAIIKLAPEVLQFYHRNANFSCKTHDGEGFAGSYGSTNQVSHRHNIGPTGFKGMCRLTKVILCHGMASHHVEVQVCFHEFQHAIRFRFDEFFFHLGKHFKRQRSMIFNHIC